MTKIPTTATRSPSGTPKCGGFKAVGFGIVLGLVASTVWAVWLSGPSVRQPTSTAPPPPSAETLAARCVEKNLTPRQRLGQLLMLGVQGAGVSGTMDEVAALFDDYSIGGVMVMSAPPDTYGDNAMLLRFKASQATPIFVTVDQEGGPVQRIGYPSVHERIFSATEVGRLPAYERTRYIDETVLPMYRFLKTKGYDGVLAPVVDIGRAQDGPLPGRTFSTDPDTVANVADAYVKAAASAGLAAFKKHAPGLGEAVRYDGSTAGNTDQAPMVTPEWSVIRDRSLKPYGSGDNVMMGTQTVPGLTTERADSQHPAALSPAAVSLMRTIVGGSALIMTDDVNTPSVLGYMTSKGVTENALAVAALEAWRAGVDIVAVVRPDPAAWNTLLEHIITEGAAAMKTDKKLTDGITRSVVRFMRLKHVDPCVLPQTG